MPISQGIATIGAGKDYADIATFFADVQPLTGNLTGLIDASLVETVTNTHNINFNLNGFEFTLDCSNPSYGDYTQGYTITVNSTGSASGWLKIAPTGSGNVRIKNLNVTQNVSSASGAVLMDEFGGTASYNLYVHDNIFNGNANLVNGYGLRFRGVNGTKYVYNNGVIQCNIGIDISLVSSPGTYVNNIVDNNGRIYGIWVNSQPSSGGFYNNAVYGTGIADWTGTRTSTTGLNNAGSGTGAADGNWGTGSGNLTGVGAAQYQSTAIGSGATYLLPTVAGVLDGANTTSPIGEHTTLINQNAIDCIGWKGLGSAVNPLLFYQHHLTNVNFGAY
jgi:hypothetical protein